MWFATCTTTWNVVCQEPWCSVPLISIWAMLVQDIMYVPSQLVQTSNQSSVPYPPIVTFIWFWPNMPEIWRLSMLCKECFPEEKYFPVFLPGSIQKYFPVFLWCVLPAIGSEDVHFWTLLDSYPWSGIQIWGRGRGSDWCYPVDVAKKWAFRPFLSRLFWLLPDTGQEAHMGS